MKIFLWKTILGFSFCFTQCLYASSIEANSYILYNNSTHNIVHAHKEHKQVPIASLTKIMSAYLVFEKLDLGIISFKNQVEIGHEEIAIQPLGASTSLELGQAVSVKTLLEAMLIASANDAAVALAKYTSQSESRFVFLMNRTAKYLGMTNTHFTHPHGIYSDNHYSTAHDLLLLIKSFYKRFPHHYRVFSLLSTNINGEKKRNRNELLGALSPFDGLKTGYTKKAGYCLAFSGLKLNQRFFGLVLGAKSSTKRFQVAKMLLTMME